MGTLSQTGRSAVLTTPLGKDVLAVVEFVASEGVSELFDYRIEAVSKRENIDFDPAIGQGCQITLGTDDGKTRIYHGIMTKAQWIGRSEAYYHYRIVLRPWTWLLSNRADCRIFLGKNVKEIIREVFTGAGFTDFQFRTTGSYPTIDYCVQYRESDLAFVSRLMEHFGIYYFFEPSDGRHTLVLADSYSSHKAVGDLPRVTFNPGAQAFQDGEQTLYRWVAERRLRTGTVTFNDYDYTAPGKDLKASKRAGEKYAHSDLEVYDYHYKYTDRGVGQNLATYRLEGEQAADHRREAAGDAASLYPGGLVTLQKHATAAENTEYLVVRAEHRFTEQTYRSGGGAGTPGYEGSFVLQPSERPFRALPVTPKPRIYGIQTAKVVAKPGEDGEEISTDEYGRIFVQFHWDRAPQKSCPIRVAQVWAGRNWGGVFLPRVGMEVVVDFLEGDPDRPLVTGCVYNGDNRPPYALPANKTQAGWKSSSSKGNAGYNEFVFEDKKASELIRMHGEKDYQVVVRNSQRWSIGEAFAPPRGSPARQTTIRNGDDALTIEQGDQTVDIKLGSHTLNAKGAITLNVMMGASVVKITPMSVEITAPSIVLSAKTVISLSAVNVNIDGAVTIDGMAPVLTPV